MTFKASTFNVQHGEGTDGLANYSRQITAMSTIDLNAIQERTGGDTGWDTPMSSANLDEAIYKPNQISGDDGNAIWYNNSTVTVLKTYEKQLSINATSPWDGGTNVDKCAVAAQVQVEGQKFYFVSTHLCQNAGADANQSLFSAIRENQIKTLLGWINSTLLGLDVIIAADFNFGPNYLLLGGGFQIDLFLRAGFTDLWRTGMTMGTATANWGDRDNNGTPDQVVDDLSTVTHDTRRIDSIYLKRVNRAVTFMSIDIPDLRANCSGALTGNPAFCPDVPENQRRGNSGDFGVKPTDHDPVVATFSINPKAVSPFRSSQYSWFPYRNL